MTAEQCAMREPHKAGAEDCSGRLSDRWPLVILVQAPQHAADAQQSPPAINVLRASRDDPCASPVNSSLADKASPPWASPHSISPTSVINNAP